MKQNLNKNIALIITSLSSFSTSFMISSINIALPAINKEFNMNAVLLGWIATAFLLASTIFTIPFGKLGDILGRKKIFIIGVIIYSFSSLLSIISISGMFLIFSRILQGIGSGMIIGTAAAILVDVYPANERGKSLGILVAAVYLGLSAGPFLGGFLTYYLGWRSIFALNVFFGIIIIILALSKLHDEWREAKGEKFDFIGSIIFGLSLFLLIYGFSILPEILGFILTGTGLAGLSGFVIYESFISTYPLIDISLFTKNRLFALSNISACINYSATYSTAFFISLYLQYVKNYSPQKAGLILVSQPIIQAVFSPLSGRLSDRIEPRYIASSGMGLIAVGLMLIISILIVLGIGFALFSSPNTNSVMSSVEKKYYGIASATLGTMRQIGQMLSMGIAMILFSLIIGRIKITTEQSSLFLQAMKISFIIFSILCFLGIYTSLIRGKIR